VKDLTVRLSPACDERFERSFDLADARMGLWVAHAGILALLPRRHDSGPTALAELVDELAACAESQERFNVPRPVTSAQHFEPPDEHAGSDVLGLDPAH